MGSQKHIRIETKSGIVLRIDKRSIQKIVLPSIIIRNSWRRLVLTAEDLEKRYEELRRKFRF